MSEAATPDVPSAAEQVPSISAAANAYQLAMSQQSTTPNSTNSQAAQAQDAAKDIIMTESTPDRPESPAILPGATVASPAPPRVGTPSRMANGNDNSRAASVHPDPPTMPSQAPPHGAPTRQYLNGKVTGVLLEGMKQLAKEQPKDPLRVLGEYLLQRSKELEGTS